MLAEMHDRMRAEARGAARGRRRGSRAAGRGPARGRSRPGRCGSRAPAAARPRRGPAAGPTARSRPPRDAGRARAAPARRRRGARTAAGRPANRLAVVGERQRDAGPARGAAGQLVGRARRRARAISSSPSAGIRSDAVAGVAQRLQHRDAAGRRVEPDAVGEPAVAGRVVGEHDADPARGGRRARAAAPRPRPARP